MFRKPKKDYRAFTWSVIVAGVVSFAFPQCGHALTPAEAAAHEAKAAYTAGQYDRAADLYLHAYEHSKNPNSLFNAARARQKAGKFESAMDLFKLYLMQNPDKAGRRDAEIQIESIGATLRAQKMGPPPIVKAEEPPKKSVVVVETPPLPRTPTPTEAEKPKESPIEVVQPPTVRPPVREFPKWKVVGGGVGLALGLGLYLGAVQTVSDAKGQLPAQTDAARQSYLSSISQAEILRGSAVAATVLGAGLLGWAAYELFN